MNYQGFLYIAFGSSFIDEAINSARSLREVSPYSHITLITDKQISANEFDNIQLYQNNEDVLTRDNSFEEDQWKKGLAKRLNALKQTPYKKTFFLDTDTYFCKSCDELFQLLDYFDLLMAYSPLGKCAPIINNKKIEGCHDYNCGVIVYNYNNKILDLFYKWHEIYNQKYHIYKNDQEAMMEALLLTDVKIYCMQNIYNFRPQYYNSIIFDNVKLIHGRHKDYEALDKELNQTSKNRLWDPIHEKIIYNKKKVPLKVSIKNSIIYAYMGLPEKLKNSYRSFKKVLRRNITSS